VTSFSSEGRDAKEALRIDRQFCAQDFEFLPQKRRREVSRPHHQQNQVP
jgi:hypothetical protein